LVRISPYFSVNASMFAWLFDIILDLGIAKLFNDFRKLIYLYPIGCKIIHLLKVIIGNFDKKLSKN
jgi:hypothetical protein